MPDSRNTALVLINQETREQRDITFEDLHRQVEAIELCDNIPETIKSQFNIAKNLAVYTWFCYSFHQICESKAYATLEYALKEKYNFHVKDGEKSKIKFRNLLERAIKEGLFKDLGYSDTWLKAMPE